jgi:hypothetical protein
MGLYSHPNGDGTETVMTDSPYYLSERKRKYFEHHNRDGAKAESERHLAWCKQYYGQQLISGEVKEVEQSFHCITILRYPRRQTA